MKLCMPVCSWGGRRRRGEEEEGERRRRGGGSEGGASCPIWETCLHAMLSLYKGRRPLFSGWRRREDTSSGLEKSLIYANMLLHLLKSFCFRGTLPFPFSTLPLPSSMTVLPSGQGRKKIQSSWDLSMQPLSSSSLFSGNRQEEEGREGGMGRQAGMAQPSCRPLYIDENLAT